LKKQRVETGEAPVELERRGAWKVAGKEGRGDEMDVDKTGEETRR